MAVRILFFAQAAGWAGQAELLVELPGPVPVSLLLARPELAGLQGKLQGTRFAVNQEYADRAAVVRDGDEVAVLPPVSGG